jgi:hypothetical protein
MYDSLAAFFCFKTALSNILYTSLDIILLIAGLIERNVSPFQEKEQEIHCRSFKRFLFCYKMLCFGSFIPAINFRNTEPHATVVMKPASEFGIPGLAFGS